MRFVRQGMHRNYGRTYLLPKANTGPGVEGQEYERVRSQILLQALVEESIRIELESYRAC